MCCCSSAPGDGESLACSTNNRDARSRAGIGIRENRDVSGPIILQKMNLKEPGYQFKQQTKALEPWKGKSPACSCLSAQIVVLEEFWVFVQAVLVHWSSNSAQSEQLGGCSHHNHSPVFPGVGSQPKSDPSGHSLIRRSEFLLFPHCASPTLSPCLNTCLANIACLQDKSAGQMLLYFGSLTTTGEWHWNGEMQCCSCWFNVTHMFHQLRGGNRGNSVSTI